MMRGKVDEEEEEKEEEDDDDDVEWKKKMLIKKKLIKKKKMMLKKKKFATLPFKIFISRFSVWIFMHCFSRLSHIPPFFLLAVFFVHSLPLSVCQFSSLLLFILRSTFLFHPFSLSFSFRLFIIPSTFSFLYIFIFHSSVNILSSHIFTFLLTFPL